MQPLTGLDLENGEGLGGGAGLYTRLVVHSAAQLAETAGRRRSWHRLAGGGRGRARCQEGAGSLAALLRPSPVPLLRHFTIGAVPAFLPGWLPAPLASSLAAATAGFDVTKVGDARVGFVGFPSVGTEAMCVAL